MNEPSDVELIRSVLSDDDVGKFGELVRRYEQRVYALCFSIVADWAEAQDLTQESFVRAWLDLGKLREPGRFAAWIRQIAFGTCTDWLRKFRPEFYRGQAIADLDEMIGSAATDQSPPETLERVELAQHLDAAIVSLPAHYRIPFILFQVDGMSHQRVAEFLELPVNTVMSRVHRAKELLRNRLSDYMKEMTMVENAFSDKKLPEDFSRKVARLTAVTLELGVADVQRSLDFYSDALGFKPEIRYEEQGQLDWVSIRSGAITLFLHHTLPADESAEARAARRSIKLFFRPDDALDLHAALKAKGHAVTDPQMTFYGAREFSMRDPDGYTIMFQKYVK